MEKEGLDQKERVLTAAFQLDEQQFMALNGGPMFKFTEAISLFVKCETQEEVDDLWEELSAGGEKGLWVAQRTSLGCPGKLSRRLWVKC
jgi:predicted 3-demethylubiquinone-9 3-methyltransferase (glyoxalase superfamily)